MNLRIIFKSGVQIQLAVKSPEQFFKDLAVGVDKSPNASLHIYTEPKIGVWLCVNEIAAIVPHSLTSEP